LICEIIKLKWHRTRLTETNMHMKILRECKLIEASLSFRIIKLIVKKIEIEVGIFFREKKAEINQINILKTKKIMAGEIQNKETS